MIRQQMFISCHHCPEKHLNAGKIRFLRTINISQFIRFIELYRIMQTRGVSFSAEAGNFHNFLEALIYQMDFMPYINCPELHLNTGKIRFLRNTEDKFRYLN